MKEVFQTLYEVSQTLNAILSLLYPRTEIIRYFAERFRVNARDIERTLFYAHQHYQSSKLY